MRCEETVKPSSGFYVKTISIFTQIVLRSFDMLMFCYDTIRTRKIYWQTLGRMHWQAVLMRSIAVVLERITCHYLRDLSAFVSMSPWKLSVKSNALNSVSFLPLTQLTRLTYEIQLLLCSRKQLLRLHSSESSAVIYSWLQNSFEWLLCGASNVGLWLKLRRRFWSCRNRVRSCSTNYTAPIRSLPIVQQVYAPRPLFTQDAFKAICCQRISF